MGRSGSRQKDRVREDFDRKASEWASLYEPPRDFRAYNFHTRLRTVVELLKPSDGVVLDIGCGTGDFIPHALERFRKVIGVEVSAEMARRCLDRFGREIQEGRVLVCQGDIEGLSLPDACLQGIICVGVLEYLLRPDAALREMSRVLEPGGYLITTVPNAASPFVAADRVSKIVRRAGSRLYRHLSGRPRDDGSYRHGYFAPWDLDRRLRQAGLEIDHRAYATFGSFMYSNYIPFSVALSEAFDPLRHRALGVIAANYIVRAVRPRLSAAASV